MTSSDTVDRYVSFQGIDCNGNARRVLTYVQQYIDQPVQAGAWAEYFTIKLVERRSLGQDDLFFVGSQISQIRALFEVFGDEAALNLLTQLEEECC